MYLHQSPVCKEGNIETCSRGKGSCPEGHYGGWGCNGCQYNNWQEYKKEHGEDHNAPDIFKDLGNTKLNIDKDKLIKAIKKVKENKKYTKFEVAEYILGWSNADQEWLDIEGIKAILHNSMRMLEDKQDGIEATYERRKEQR